MIWTHGEEELNMFIHYVINMFHISNIHDQIKFPHEFSIENVNFLDTTVKTLTEILKKNIHKNYIIEHSNGCVQTLKSNPLVGFRKLANLRTYWGNTSNRHLSIFV